MKLTPEQHAEATRALLDWQAAFETDLHLYEAAFLAGCRYQHQKTLERAAKMCAGAKYEVEYDDWRRGYNKACQHRADDIRALPFEDTSAPCS